MTDMRAAFLVLLLWTVACAYPVSTPWTDTPTPNPLVLPSQGTLITDQMSPGCV